MIGVSQEQFLGRVRAALADRGAPVALPDDLEVARVIAATGELIRTFMDRVEQAKMHAYRVPDPAAMVAKVLAIVQAAGARSALVPEGDLPARERLVEALREAGVTLLNPGDLDAGFAADVGITGVAAAIAETGSMCLVSGDRRRRLASLAVPCHIGIVSAGQILPDLLDWSAGLPADMPAVHVLVSGPSKTADIELTLVMGVHGPKEEHVIVIG